MTSKTLTQKFLDLLQMGYTPQQAQKELKLTDAAVKQHFEKIRDMNQKWLSYLSASGYTLAFQKSLQDALWSKEVARKAIIVYEQRIHAGELKWGYALSNVLAEFNKANDSFWKMQNETPMVESFRQFVQDNVADSPGGKKNRSGSSMAFLPDEALT